MSLATADIPSDPEALRAFALACQAELKAAELSVQLPTLEIEKLKFQIAKLRRMQFGRSSEKLNRKIEAEFQFSLELAHAAIDRVAVRVRDIEVGNGVEAECRTGERWFDV